MMYNKTGAGAFVGRITRYSRPSVRLSVCLSRANL